MKTKAGFGGWAVVADLTLRYGLFETLDRDHFYPTHEAAVREVQGPGNSGRCPRTGRRATGTDARSRVRAARLASPFVLASLPLAACAVRPYSW